MHEICGLPDVAADAKAERFSIVSSSHTYKNGSLEFKNY
jgi:hypothetical protein